MKLNKKYILNVFKMDDLTLFFCFLFYHFTLLYHFNIFIYCYCEINKVFFHIFRYYKYGYRYKK